MNDDWYYQAGGRVRGPVSYEQILAGAFTGELTAEDLVRRGPDGQWTAAASLLAGGTADAAQRRLDELRDLLEQAVGSGECSGDDADFELSDRSQPETLDGSKHSDDEWYCQSLGTEFGPMPWAELRRLAALQELSAGDLVRQGRAGAWVRAETVAGLPVSLAGEFAEPGLAAVVGDGGTALGGLDEFEFVDTLRPGTVSPSPPTLLQPPPEASADPCLVETVREAEPARSAITPAGAWYLRHRGVEHGPMEFAELAHLIELGRLTAQDEVRCGENGAWQPAAEVCDVAEPGRSPPLTGDMAALAAAVPVARSGSARPIMRRSFGRRWRSRLGGWRWRWRAVPLRVRLTAAGGVGLTVFAALVLASGHRDLDDYARLVSLWNEHRQLRSRQAAPAEWQDFADRVQRETRPMIARLEKTAGARRPLQQHLLWAARDCLPRAMTEARERPSRSEHLLARHLGEVEALLGGRAAVEHTGDDGEADFAYPGEPAPEAPLVEPGGKRTN